MLGKLWRWLKRWLQRWRKSPRPETARPQPTAPVRPAATRPDAEYEALFLGLLDQLQPDWDYGQIQGWLLAHALKPTDLAAWLERFGQRLLASPAPNPLLAERLMQFSQIDRSEVSIVARDIGRRLLGRTEIVQPEEISTVQQNPTNDEDSIHLDSDISLLEEREAFNHALKLRELGSYEEAITAFDKILELSSTGWTSSKSMALLSKGAILCDHLHQHEAALKIFERVLELEPQNPVAWQHRGEALIQLERYEESINSSEEAISLIMKFPKVNSYELIILAASWGNRGHALSCLRQYEKALTSFAHALNLNPNDYITWKNRGNALTELGRHNEAIASYDKAIELKPDYHEAWLNRGVVLSDLERNEEALSSYDTAIEFKLDYHEAWCNRGNALSALGRNEEAISGFDRAIEIKPDYHGAWFNRGTPLSALDRHEDAISSYDKAIELKPDDHLAWLKRGNALLALGRNEDAISSFDRAIEIKPDDFGAWYNRGVALSNLGRNEAAIDNYRQGLRHVQRSDNPKGWGWLHWGMSRVYYFCGRFASPADFYFRQALSCYHTALEALTPEAFPEDHLKVVQDMIRAYLGLGNPAEANHWREQGLAVYRELINRATPAKRRQLEVEFSGFSQVQVDVLVQSQQFVTALETAERAKNRCLTRILDQWQEQVISPSYAEMRQLLNDSTAILYWHQSDDALTTFLILPDQEQPQILETDALRQRQRQFSQWQIDWNRDYRNYRIKKDEATDPASAKANHIWRRELPQRLSRLREILGIAAIEQHLTGITQLILVPHRDLHRFPIHALFRDLTCTYLPSLQIGLSLQNRSIPNLQTASLLSVADPQSDREEMLYAQIESAVIQQYFTQVTALSPQQASRTNVTEALRQPHNLFHFTGHGSHDDQNPQNSAIGLANGETLTAKEISQLPLQSCYLASIAACETALTSRQSIDSEYVGLTSAFLQAGTAHVLSTLWNVEEISSTWLMIRFYQQLLSGNFPDQALQQATQWLRAVTPTALAEWLQDLAALNLPSNIREYLRQEAERIRESITIGSEQPSSEQPSSEQPLYAHPYYWAAFTLTGTFTGTAPP